MTDDETETEFDPITQNALVALDDWHFFEKVKLENRTLERNLVISATRKDPAHRAFDILRTRMMQALANKGWYRIGVTSPTDGCGKTFVAANLAISLARSETNRVLLMDLNLRKPDLARILGLERRISMAEYLSGMVEPADFFLRLGPSLVAGLNSIPADDPAEIMQSVMAKDVLDEVQEVLAPDVTIFDLPPMLSSDEAVACLPHLDAALLVVGGGMSTEKEIKQAEALLKEQVPLLGVVLNNSED
ncbi:MAG: hypothetical protein CSA68_02910 [Rhodobacterales bacterium]|nr:MAG: hypothetical protein CSA68_02910 [Rhodobacterales bacterium]